MNSDWKSALSGLLPEGHTPDDEPSAGSAGKLARKDVLRIELDRKRAGKTATIVSGFTIPDEDVASLARRMKQRLGTGGSARDGEILIQGDRRADVAAFLAAEGYKTKIV